MHAGAVLLVEDNQDIAEFIYEFLEQVGYSVDYTSDGLSGLNLAVANRYDLIILDLMLPRLDGYQITKKLREDAHSSVPILVLSARDTLADKLKGFDLGVDDYLVKPFEVRELAARVRVLLRRQRDEVAPKLITIDDLVIDTSTATVKRAGQLIKLPPIPYRILVALARVTPRYVQRSELEKEIWGDDLPDSDALRSHIYILRKRLDQTANHSLLQTMVTMGYRIVSNAENLS
ncbi:MAG: response regulator transcription factor [Gammaproteobacteria bacterium]|nr:response regulator transcription factor [Gammaproteobacteria bacterium]